MKKLLYLFAIAMSVTLGLAACSDDDSDNATPVITGVRVCDPEKADSLFTKSSQGQVVAIIGQHLNNALAVYINDQKVSFSTTMNTNHSIIVIVPSETDGFQLAAFNPELKEEIRVETTHGTATFAFQVLAASPSISRIQAAYPREAGDVLNIYGSNLVSINEIYFTDLTATQLDTTVWTEIGGNHVEVADYETVVQNHYLDSKTGSYTTTSQLSLIIPELPFDEGSLVVDCAAGVRYFNYTKRPGVPVIKSLSSDMPVIGETLIITGNDFVQLDSIIIGDVVYKNDEYTVAETESEIEIPITKVPGMDSEGGISIVTPGGVAHEEQIFQYATLIYDCDNETGLTGVNMGWSPDVVYGNFEVGGTGLSAHFDSYGQWWGQMLFFARDWTFTPFTLPGYDVIPANTPASNIYLAFEVYDGGSSFNNGGEGYQGLFRLELWNAANNATDATPDITYINFEWDDYDAGTFKNPDGPILQDSEGEAHVGTWYRSVFPFTDLTTVDSDGAVTGNPYLGATYQDIYNNGLSIVRLMSYTQGVKTGTVDVYVDNVRLIYIK